MKFILMLAGLALAIRVNAQVVMPSERFRAELTAIPEMAVVADTLDAGVPLGFISAVSADRAGNLYVLHRPDNGDPIVLLDSEGAFVRSWGEGLFSTPHGIRVDQDDNVWTVDAGTSVVRKFTQAGDLLLSVRLDVPEAPRPFCGSTDVTFGGDGSLLLTDGYCNGRVVKLDSTGNEIGGWGASGSDRGQFLIPHGIAIAADGRVLIADRNNSRIQIFDQDGGWLDAWQYAGLVSSVAVSPAGKVYASLVFDPVNWTEGHIVEIDPLDGHMLSRVAVVAHQLAVGPDGAILPAVEDVILRLRLSPGR
jgi:DNA-binding beta-propeller fold protein YncE